jgi:hypothetical protein
MNKPDAGILLLQEALKRILRLKIFVVNPCNPASAFQGQRNRAFIPAGLRRRSDVCKILIGTGRLQNALLAGQRPQPIPQDKGTAVVEEQDAQKQLQRRLEIPGHNPDRRRPRDKQRQVQPGHIRLPFENRAEAQECQDQAGELP